MRIPQIPVKISCKCVCFYCPADFVMAYNDCVIILSWTAIILLVLGRGGGGGISNEWQKDWKERKLALN